VIKSRKIGWAGHSACMGRGVYRDLVGKPEERGPLGNPRRRWKENIKTDLQEMGWGMEWIDLAQNRDGWQHLVMR